MGSDHFPLKIAVWGRTPSYGEETWPQRLAKGETLGGQPCTVVPTLAMLGTSTHL